MHVMSKFGDELYLRSQKMFELKQISKLVNPHLGKAPTLKKPEETGYTKGTRANLERNFYKQKWLCRGITDLTTIPCLIVMSLNLVFFP